MASSVHYVPGMLSSLWSAMMNEKERVLAVVGRNDIDRPPVLCMGGMMNAAIVEVMEQTGHLLPAAHHDAQLMAALAADVAQWTGFENFGIPFCMTVEAEVLGSEIDFGTLACEPKIAHEIFPSVKKVEFRDIPTMISGGRIAVLAEAARILSAEHPETPIIGSLSGPISTVASIVDPITFFKELRKERDGAHAVLDYVTDFLIAYARVLIENGVTVIGIGDPTATGEILGPKMFTEYALPYLNKLIDGIHAAGAPVLLHICGDMNTVRSLIPSLHSDAISTDAMVNLRQLKADYPELLTMGNLSTFLLESGPADRIVLQTQRLVQDGIDIISPACGLSTSTALPHIRALTRTVKEGA